ncbi:hypothetical protein F4V47_09460 [Lactococcus garvieae subsp. garvieae]|uniref:hypothetical protein n=1 Tax=Lactococcus garvieae TaxID=1363 RepID=UPI0005A63D8D|nr:hypothetical protein [Lactococcus garvieae]KAA8710683.1 hypothetical protein F4V47_09460 [Lactococcus garvieae subsp. garvieae]MDG6192270.1 hypothetical protein [Lactococcus garvieae]PCR99391.1 hypothetical protein RU85_GL001142 [Lactococcus garvieae]QPR49399.1 hypothetical protein I6G86_02795 [Lactococcus garvieae]
MSKIVLFGGQGNLRMSDLVKVNSSINGKKILNHINQSSPFSYEYFKNILSGEIPLNETYASMLSTFIYNWWRVSEIDLSKIEYFSSHSAGIFNVAFASESVELDRLLAFIKKRADLMESYLGSEEMWLALTSSCKDLETTVCELSEIIKVSIRTNHTTEVLAFSQSDKLKLEEHAANLGIPLRLKSLGLKIPYHTQFLSDLRDNYYQLVDNLNIIQNSSFKYLYHTKNLKQEIKNQLDITFNWEEILLEVGRKNLEVYDLSSNRFISKNLRAMDTSIKFL